MLMRIRGGAAGIKAYLEEGRKAGREGDREMLDERVTLAGDLDFLDGVINGMNKRGDRYLHITLSFREDAVSRKTLQAVVADFKAFAFSAYEDDEYHCYAEAHLPRIKSYPNQESGASIERKPHIHVVIPQQNLLTGRHLNPFGRVANQTLFLEAFQEQVNATYGLASPKDHPRLGMTGEADVLSRLKGDVFQGANRGLKAEILAAVVERGITDTGAFRDLVAEFGEVRVRNAGKDNEYLNVKSAGAKRGVNLKETAFSRGWIERSLAEKQALLAAEVGGYSEPGRATVLAPAMAKRLAEWHSIRARELKYLNSGHRKPYAAYRAAEPDEKRAIVAELEQRFVVKYRGQAVGAETGIEVLPQTPVRQLVVDLAGAREQRVRQADPAMVEIKQQLDGRSLLAAVSHSHGVDSDKYVITSGQDGGDRIRCGSRQLNVSDFLTKELHVPWREAEPLLQRVYAAQLAKASVPVRRAPTGELWREYRTEWQPQQREAKAAAWAAQKVSAQQRRGAIRQMFTEQRQRIDGDQALGKAERQAALSVARMEKAVAETQLREVIGQERQVLKARYQKPLEAQYRDFLTEKAQTGDETALLELRRRVPSGSALTTPVTALLAAADWEEQQAPLVTRLDYEVKGSGQVAYRDRQGQALITDAGRKVHTHRSDWHTLELALRLSVQKFGRNLTLDGDDAFKHAVVDTAVDRGFDVEFTEPELNQRAEQRRRYQQKARAAGDELLHPKGELVSYGRAPYLFAEQVDGESYYVTLKTARGQERTLWGIDLERSLKAAGAEIGDRLCLSRAGSKTVTVADEKGQETSVERVTWHTEQLDADRVKTREREAELSRSLERLRQRERGDFSR